MCFKAFAASVTLLAGCNLQIALPSCSRPVSDLSFQATFVSIPHPSHQQPSKTLSALQYSRILVSSFLKPKIWGARAIAWVRGSRTACRASAALHGHPGNELLPKPPLLLPPLAKAIPLCPRDLALTLASPGCPLSHSPAGWQVSWPPKQLANINVSEELSVIVGTDGQLQTNGLLPAPTN